MTTDELRAKFENWWLRNGDPFDLHKVAAWETWQVAHASRDAEVEALRKDAERYRWLRNRAVHFELNEGKRGTPYIVYGLGMGDSVPTCGTEADSMIDDCKAIDATMQEETK